MNSTATRRSCELQERPATPSTPTSSIRNGSSTGSKAATIPHNLIPTGSLVRPQQTATLAPWVKRGCPGGPHGTTRSGGTSPDVPSRWFTFRSLKSSTRSVARYLLPPVVTGPGGRTSGRAATCTHLRGWEPAGAPRTSISTSAPSTASDKPSLLVTLGYDGLPVPP